MVKPARNVSAAPAVSKPRMVGAHKLYLELCRDYGDPDQAFDELVAFYRLGGSFRVNPHPPYNSEINRVGFCKANPLRWEDPRRWRSGRLALFGIGGGWSLHFDLKDVRAHWPPAAAKKSAIKKERVKAAMREMARDELVAILVKNLAATFSKPGLKVSRSTCRRARDEVLDEPANGAHFAHVAHGQKGQ